LGPTEHTAWNAELSSDTSCGPTEHTDRNAELSSDTSCGPTEHTDRNAELSSDTSCGPTEHTDRNAELSSETPWGQISLQFTFSAVTCAARDKRPRGLLRYYIVCLPVVQTSQLVLYREIIAVCSEIHTKHINTLCGQNVELLNVKLVVHIVSTCL